MKLNGKWFPPPPPPLIVDWESIYSTFRFRTVTQTRIVYKKNNCILDQCFIHILCYFEHFYRKNFRGGGGVHFYYKNSYFSLFSRFMLFPTFLEKVLRSCSHISTYKNHTRFIKCRSFGPLRRSTVINTLAFSPLPRINFHGIDDGI